MRRFQYLFIILLIFIAVGCSKKGDRTTPTTSFTDTLYNVRAAMEVFDERPEEAMALIDSAVQEGTIGDEMALMLKARLYSQSSAPQHLDSAHHILEGLMDSPFVNEDDNREMVLDLLVNTCRKQHNYEQCLRWATAKADLCRQNGEETEALRTEAEIGVIFAKLGDEERGLAKLNGVIANLDGQHNVDEMDACIIAIKRKIQVLQELERHEEVIPLAHHIIDMVNDYQQHHEAYRDNSYRLSNDPEETRLYCAFFRAQAQGYLAYSYASLAEQKEGNKAAATPDSKGGHAISKTAARDSAYHYLALFEQSSFGHSLDGRWSIAPTWLLMGSYDKMLATYDEVESQMGDDTITMEYLEMLRGRAVAANAMGNLHAAINYWQRFVALGYYLSNKVHKSQVHEYAVRYRLQEERLNTEREEAAKQRITIVAILLGIIVVIVVVFVVMLIRRIRAIEAKDTVITKEITEKIENTEPYTKPVETVKTVGGKPVDKITRADLLMFSDSEMFEFFSYVIVTEKLFLNSDFGRQQLMDRFRLSKDRVGAAFSKGSKFHSVKNYLNEVRLDYSTRLLAEEPDLNFYEVALRSGYASYIVFSRNFKLRYAITPTEFRERKDINLPMLEDEEDGEGE